MDITEATMRALNGDLKESKNKVTEAVADDSKYRAVKIMDASETGVEYGIIMLNNKHTVQDFQKAMHDSYERHKDEILEYGDDLTVVLNDIDPAFDWFEFPIDSDYLTI